MDVAFFLFWQRISEKGASRQDVAKSMRNLIRYHPKNPVIG